jgi:hypothetical protein
MPQRVGRKAGLPRDITGLMGLIALALLVAFVWAVWRLIVHVSAAPIIWLIVLVALAAFLYWLVFRVHKLPLSLIGVSDAESIPAIPVKLSELPGTIFNLLKRNTELTQAREGLSTVWTIGDRTETAYTFMGVGASVPAARKKPATQFFLDKPEQFAMSWTTFGGVYERATHKWLAPFAASLTDPAEATRQFWPTIARFGIPYNLLILERVGPDVRRFKDMLGADWTSRMEEVWQAGELYVIDMTFFTPFEAHVVSASPRFTPGTLTFLQRNAETHAITPFAVRVSNSAGDAVLYRDADPAWLYALQAAKASITVWGIWLGHVYHWHIVTGAMVLTMRQHLPARHPVRQVFGLQSNYLIGFDQFLLLDWSIAPPTSVTSSRQFLEMTNAFAKGRDFFDDDPGVTLERFGLRQDDFTSTGGAAWDEYPVARYLLEIYDAAADYVGKVVDAYYPDDRHVADDKALQQWIKASGASADGNVRGLPEMRTRGDLKRVLASLIYRVTAHGNSRIAQSVNPAISFVPNFSPCLQSTTLPPANTPIVFKAGSDSPPGALSLADFLPNTGTIGELISFAFTFTYSAPYIPLIPLTGIDRDLPFVGRRDAAHAGNDALVAFRNRLQAFMTLYAEVAEVDGPPAQIHQWPLNIET